ncbi:hypothetical protein ZWY2020_041632 [Hordeum vulgare]|nr:hypothetical protein ZWY2020_041632 [Hordeum vulgare]
MSSTGSRSDDSDVNPDEMALRIAMEWSKVETGGNLGSGATPPLPRRMPAEPDENECLLAWVYLRSLTTAETDARCFQRNNVKVFRLAIEQLVCEAKETAKEKARLARLKREKDMAVWRIKGLIILFDNDSDDSDNGISSSDDQDPPPTADGYSCVGDPKGKSPTRKW